MTWLNIKKRVRGDTKVADMAFRTLQLDDVFDIDYQLYREFYEAYIRKEGDKGVKRAISREFNQNEGRISNRIRRTLKGAAIRAGYRVRQDGKFDKTLGSAKDILRRD